MSLLVAGLEIPLEVQVSALGLLGLLWLTHLVLSTMQLIRNQIEWRRRKKEWQSLEQMMRIKNRG